MGVGILDKVAVYLSNIYQNWFLNVLKISELVETETKKKSKKTPKKTD